MARRLRIIKTRRRKILLALSMVLMIAITGLIALFGQPSKAKIVTSSAQDDATLDIEQGESTLKGMYFTMRYQTSLNTVADITGQDHNAIEAYRLNRSTLEDRRLLVVTVKHTVEGGLEEDSSYKFRIIQPTVYKLTTEQFNGQTAHILTRNDNTEVTAFIPHGDKTAVLSYTSGGADSAYDDALRDFKTFQWL